MSPRKLLGSSLVLGLSLCTGCASYVAPGRGADLTPAGLDRLRTQQSDTSIERMLERKPLAQFPAAIAVARIQSAGYRSYTAEGFGQGAYSVVTTRDVESEADLARLSKLPMLKGVAPVSRLLLDAGNLKTDEELRQAAGRLGAELLLIYTFDTTFKTEDNAAPLTVISLGLSPNKVVYCTSTASALLLDTRNGYIYGVAEATEKTNQLTNAWQDSSAADQSRRRAESAVFTKLVGEFEKTWAGVIKTYAKPATADVK